jgi:hypothetical protein
MVTAILLPILAATAAAAPQGGAAPAADQQVQVWLSGGDELVRGDKVRVYLKANGDGYMLVLHAEPDGRIHVLFPVDPGDDNYVRGGKTYEVRGRGDRDAFTVYGTRGAGTVYAAFSQDPFQFGGFVLNGHWDYRAQAFSVGDDPEADLTALAQQMAGTGQFTYDLAHYDVVQQVASGSSYYGGSYYPYYGYYDGWYRPWRSGIYFGISFGSPWYACWACDGYYNPWFYSAWYDPFFYYPYAGFYRPYYYGYYGSYWYRPYSVSRYAYGYGWGNGRGWWPLSRGLARGGQHYGFYYVQPGRRTLGLYASGRSVFLSGRRAADVGAAVGGRGGAGATGVSGRRAIMPPATDGGRAAMGPRRIGAQESAEPRVAQPRPLQASPRATPRRESAAIDAGVIRRVPDRGNNVRTEAMPRGLVPVGPGDARAMPSRVESGPQERRGLSPVTGSRAEPQRYERPQLERRQGPQSQGRSYEAPRRSSPSPSPSYTPRSPGRSAPPSMSRPAAPRVSAPSRSSGPSRPSAPSRGGGRPSSGGRRRG